MGAKEFLKIISPEGENRLSTTIVKARIRSLLPVSLIIVACITFIIYLPALRNNFVNWDDSLYVYENQNIRSLDIWFLRWNITAEVASLWHPLTMFSLALDYATWGLNPFGYHLTNILFHSLNTFLVFILVVRLTECKTIPYPSSLIAASVTALLFGIHPLHVESVAWVSERKDVLSAFFFLMTILAYLKYASSKKPLFYVACIVLFILALMSKPMAVSLSIVLLLLDYYPLNRLRGTGIKALLIEKLPFAALSILSILFTVWASHTGVALRSFEGYSLIGRLSNAIHSYIFYLLKMALPFNLAPLYPFPERPLAFGLGAVILFLAITLYCIYSSGRGKLFLVVWIYYIITLLPVIGIVQVGGQAAADRYTYLPSLGPSLLVGCYVAAAFERSSTRRYRLAMVISLALITGMLANRTLRQIAVWHDSIALWSHEVKLFPNMALFVSSPQADVYYYQGNVHNNSGDYRQAIRNYNQAIGLTPLYAKAYSSRGVAYYRLGDYRNAIEDQNRSIELNPQDASYYYNRGLAYDSLSNYHEAIRDYSKAAELNPSDAETYAKLASVHSRIGKTKEAMAYYQKAVDLGLKR